MIIKNAIKCKLCGDVIESKTRTGVVKCSCGAVGVEGGKHYLKRIGDKENYEELSESK